MNVAMDSTIRGEIRELSEVMAHRRAPCGSVSTLAYIHSNYLIHKNLQ